MPVKPSRNRGCLPALRTHRTAVRRRISLLSLCLAWLCANGAIWDVVQAVAWAKMVRDYSRVMPVARAVEITFNGTAPCTLCVLVEEGRAGESTQQVERSHERVLLALHLPDRIVLGAPDQKWSVATDAIGLIRTDPVPVPPPRC